MTSGTSQSPYRAVGPGTLSSVPQQDCLPSDPNCTWEVFSFYSPFFQSRFSARAVIEADSRAALRRHEFVERSAQFKGTALALELEFEVDEVKSPSTGIQPALTRQFGGKTARQTMPETTRINS